MVLINVAVGVLLSMQYSIGGKPETLIAGAIFLSAAGIIATIKNK